MAKTKAYNKPELRNIQEACDYINAAHNKGQAEWLHALGRVAKAHGMSTIARGLGVNRSTLYHMLSRKGNPVFKALLPVFPALEMKLTIVVAEVADATS